MKEFAKDLKTVYTAVDEEAALEQLERVKGKWSPQYPYAMKRWYENWDAVSPIFKFSADVRKAFYTTNAIESLNATLRRLNRQRSVPGHVRSHQKMDDADPELGSDPGRTGDHVPGQDSRIEKIS